MPTTFDRDHSDELARKAARSRARFLLAVTAIAIVVVLVMPWVMK